MQGAATLSIDNSALGFAIGAAGITAPAVVQTMTVTQDSSPASLPEIATAVEATAIENEIAE
mgnify:CR=1 FL=1